MAEERGETLESIYALIPAIACKGLCWEQCSAIGATNLEMGAMLAAAKGELPDFRVIEIGTEEVAFVASDGLCPFLDRATKRCTVYAQRPAICRIWGVEEKMRCEHGCKPIRYLPRTEGFNILNRVRKISEKGGIR